MFIALYKVLRHCNERNEIEVVYCAALRKNNFLHSVPNATNECTYVFIIKLGSTRVNARYHSQFMK